MEGEHLVVSCILSVNGQTIATHALNDSGATGISFIDKDFVRHFQLTLTPLQNPRSLEVIDGRLISSGDISHTTTITLSINKHQEQLPMFVTKLGLYPIVLGIPWMDRHDINIRFRSCTVTFGSQYCSTHCLPKKSEMNSSNSTLNLMSKVAQKCEPVVRVGDGDIGALTFTSDPNPHEIQVDDFQNIPKTFAKKIQIAALSGRSFQRVAYKQKLTIFSIFLHEINTALCTEEKTKKKLVLEDYIPKEYHDFLPLFSEALDKKLVLEDYIPKEYHDFLPLFSEALDKKLPPHRSYDQKIPLREGFTPPFGPLYSLSKTELETLKEWLEDTLSKGFICASSSPAASPILFVKKNDGTI